MPLPLKLLKTPPITSKSADAKSELDSLSVMVIVAAAPVFKSNLSADKITVGNTVSTPSVFVLLPSDPSVF